MKETPAGQAAVDQINAAGNDLALACEMFASVWVEVPHDGTRLFGVTAVLRSSLAGFDKAMLDFAALRFGQEHRDS